MASYSKKAILMIILILTIILLGLLIQSLPARNELVQLTGKESFAELKTYFTDLSKEKGAQNAFAVLKNAKISSDVDIHLLGHIIGDILYEQKGAEGMKYCTHDFRNACSHSIVIGLFLDNGVGALPKIKSTCKSAPGGKAAYSLCFHGLGHGVLAYIGYSLEKAIDICSKLKQDGKNGKEFSECSGGVIMEMISGGDHDKELWRKQSRKYLNTNHPLSPCDTGIIPPDAKEICYIYLTPHLLMVAGSKPGNPSKNDFRLAFTYCNNISDDNYRKACYGGFGKELVPLTLNANLLGEQEVKRIHDWCSLTDFEDGKRYCLWYSLGSIFWGGTNNYDSAIRFCTILGDNYKFECYKNLVEMVFEYKDDKIYLGHFCSKLPTLWNRQCAERLKK